MLNTLIICDLHDDLAPLHRTLLEKIWYYVLQSTKYHLIFGSTNEKNEIEILVFSSYDDPGKCDRKPGDRTNARVFTD